MIELMNDWIEKRLKSVDCGLSLFLVSANNNQVIHIKYI